MHLRHSGRVTGEGEPAVDVLATVRGVPSPAVRVLVVGAGGHARVCIEVLEDSGYEVAGAVSRDGLGASELGVPVLGVDAELASVMLDHRCREAFVAIGDNRARRAIADMCVDRGVRQATAVSRFAVVSRRADVATGAVLMPGAVVNAATTIGRGAIVNTNASVDHDCVIGEFAHIAPGVAVCGGVRLGAGTLVGVGACIAPGVVVGENAVIGAGAAVVHDVAANSTVVGVPARKQ